MGAHFGLTAIKTNNVEKVLEATSDYYRNHNLSLAEIAIGNKKSKYVRKRYKSVRDFESNYEYAEENESDEEYSTDFNCYFNLKENPDWIIFSYSPRQARYTLNINRDLASFLSKKLKTGVIEYYYYSYKTLFKIRKYEAGKLKGELIVSGMFVEFGFGYFKKFYPKDYKDIADVQRKVIAPFLRKNRFDPDSDELAFFNPKKWRRFYLEGSTEDILRFFLHSKETFY